MKVVFRVDASVQMGSGHLMRCLTLAGALRDSGAQVSFICRELPGHLCGLVETKGYRVYRLPMAGTPPDNGDQQTCHAQWLGVKWEMDVTQTREIMSNEERDAGWLVVDHYALDSRWEKRIRPLARKIMVIDDLADRPHNCDLLLDQNLYENMETRYLGLVPADCRLLLGPKYALLRPEFRAAREKLRERDGTVRRILIFFGGSDPDGETVKALKAVRTLNLPEIAVDVVVGRNNPFQDQIKKLCLGMPNVTYYCQVENMAQLMAAADLTLGAGGSATWERCFLGLPSITVILAANQVKSIDCVSMAGATWRLGWGNTVTAEDLVTAIKRAVDNPEVLKKMGISAMRLMDGVMEEKSAT